MASRRFSQAISEGDGISVLVQVRDPAAARAAEDQGAEAVVVDGAVGDLRSATELPILWAAAGAPGEAAEAGADAYVVRGDDDRVADLYSEAMELRLDCVIRVGSEEALEEALAALDPEILLLGTDGQGNHWETTFDLLSSVPAGKLAIASVEVADRDQVLELERAGFDAVIVGARDVAELVGDAPPPV